MTREQWEAIKTNDKRYDGQFFYALKTTKTVCRPSCTARTCNPKNVIIFDTLEDAIQQGFRPCRRCCPDRMEWDGVKKELTLSARKFIEERYAEKFSLETISGSLYVNESYLLRVFKEETGHTLLWYHNYVRCEKAKELLTCPELKVSLISHKVGYATSSHFTKVFKNMYGCTPSSYRADYLKSLD